MVSLSSFKLLILSLFHLGKGSSSESRLKLTSYCSSTCQGNYTLTYECEVMGFRSDLTVWSGSAFDCARRDNEITLQHSLYYTESNIHARPNGACNNGSIVAQILRVENDTYVSQLNITMSDSLIGKTIECLHYNTTLMRVGEEALHIEEFFPPPNIDKVANVESREITFNWTEIAPECPAIQYNIQASNCGCCPTTTNHTTITCTDVPTNGGTCTFIIKIFICGYKIRESDISVQLDYKADHTVLYAVAGVLFGIILTTSVVTLGIFFTIRFAGVCSGRVGRKLNHNQQNQQPTTSHRQVDSIYACVGKTTGDDEYSTIKIFDNKNKGVYGVEDAQDALEKQGTMHERPPDLTSLLCRFQRQASIEWYPLGLAFGVPEDCLEELKQYTEEQCLIEVLKYWLRNHYGRPTWQEVEKVQEKVKTYIQKNAKHEFKYSSAPEEACHDPHSEPLYSKINIYT